MRRLQTVPSLGCLVLALGVLAGCGGTNTTDGASAYNRGVGQDISPTSPDKGASSANSVLGIYAFINAEEIKDAKQATSFVDALKKLPVPPKRLFLLGATAGQAEFFKKPLAAAKISPVPVYGPASGDWAKVIKAFGSDKLFGNGPTMGGPNIDALTADQSKQSSTFVADGVRFFVLNTDTPVKNAEKGQIPRLWLTAQLDRMKEMNAVMVGWRPLRSLGEADPTPALAISDPMMIFGKSNHVRAFVSSSTKAPVLSRPDEKSVYQLAVGGAMGEDKLPKVGIIEVRKGNGISARVVSLSATLPPTTVIDAVLFETVAAKTGTAKTGEKVGEKPAEKPTDKTTDKAKTEEPPKVPSTGKDGNNSGSN